MNDRELLELAAKAAGIAVVRSRLEDPLCMDMCVERSFRNKGQIAGPWNPLTDDGDALRLAVKLNLSSMMIYDYDDGIVGERRTVWPPNGKPVDITCQEYAEDRYATTRRAIVRAAAEIGREQAMSDALAQPVEQAQPVAWRDLLREARDNCKASIAEDGISAMRREYRVELEARLTAALAAAPARLTDEDIWNSNEIMAANAKCGLLMLDLAFLARAVEAEVLRKMGVVE